MKKRNTKHTGTKKGGAALSNRAPLAMYLLFLATSGTKRDVI